MTVFLVLAVVFAAAWVWAEYRCAQAARKYAHAMDRVAQINDRMEGIVDAAKARETRINDRADRALTELRRSA